MYVYVSTFSNSFSSETTGPIEAKFHVEPPWDGEMKVYSNGPGHMTNMATVPIYGKPLKNLLLWNQKVGMSLKLDMQHQVLEFYQVYSNDDTVLTQTFFTARSNLRPYGDTF